MRPQPLGAVLSLSVDLESATGAAAPDRETTGATVERLAGMLEAAGVAAVWATGDPVGSRLVRLVRDTCSSHEIALLAERSVAGFVRRLAQARAAGIPVTTLVAGDDALIPSGELLTKHCISAVRTASCDRLASSQKPGRRLGNTALRPVAALARSAVGRRPDVGPLDARRPTAPSDRPLHGPRHTTESGDRRSRTVARAGPKPLARAAQRCAAHRAPATRQFAARAHDPRNRRAIIGC